MIYLLAIYLYINTLSVGGYLYDSFNDDSLLRRIAMSILLTLFAVLFVIIDYIWEFFKFLNGFFQINFLIQFWFTKHWRNNTKEELERMNRFRWSEKTLRNYFWNKAIDMVNKRNNYNPDSNATSSTTN